MLKLARLNSCYTNSGAQLKHRGYQFQKIYWLTTLKGNIPLTYEFIFLKGEVKMPGEGDTNLLFLYNNSLHLHSIS